MTFLGASIAGLLILACFFNADFGMQWDFDVLAMFALPATLLLALWWNDRLSPRAFTALSIAVASTAFTYMVTPYLIFP